jgi:pimeloyl-ACP methyl ester carboxylesterase
VSRATVSFVLIHGGGTSSRYWDRLLPHLEHPALAVDLPGRAGKPADLMELTVQECAASVVADVRDAGLDRIVLVAHSSGGLFVPDVVAALAPRVLHIVLSAANVPPEGGTGLDAMKASHRDRVIAGMDAARREGWVLRTPGPEPAEKVREAYGGDPLPADLVEFMRDPVRCVRDSMSFYFQPVHWSAIGDVPVTFVKHRRDRPSPPALQDEQIARLPAPGVVEIDSGHIPAVTHPEDFARILDAIAQGKSPVGP